MTKYTPLVRVHAHRQSINAAKNGSRLEALDDIVRYSAFALMMWLGVIMLRDFCDRVAGRLGAASALSSAAYLLATKPGLSVFGVDLDLLLLPIYDVSPALAWLFCLSQFDDNFEVLNTHRMVVAAKFITGGGGFLSWYAGEPMTAEVLTNVSNIIVICMLIHLVIVAWQGRHEDLVESRRKFRSIFVSAVVVITFGILMSKTGSRRAEVENIELLLQAISFLAIAIFLHWRISSRGGEDLFFQERQAATSAAQIDHCDLSAADQHDLDVISNLSHSELLVPGLTIAKMAHDANIPEHRLRHLINQHMGYRNFSDYLNHHRVEAAKSRLANRDDRHTPVLTIAMDLGYGSLGPFNRAFKERTGQTPTEYRNISLSSHLAAAQ